MSPLILVDLKIQKAVVIYRHFFHFMIYLFLVGIIVFNGKLKLCSFGHSW